MASGEAESGEGVNPGAVALITVVQTNRKKMNQHRGNGKPREIRVVMRGEVDERK